jgi:hypothetical protein
MAAAPQTISASKNRLAIGLLPRRQFPALKPLAPG